MEKKFRQLRPLNLRTYSVLGRKSKVEVNDFAKPLSCGGGFEGFLKSLPDILAGREFKEFVSRLKEAERRGKPMLFALGAHVIKVGLNPIIIQLMKKGWITGLALNGAGIVHDFEIAYCGRTSEEVEAQLGRGMFGMAKETAELLNTAIARGAAEDMGLGEAVSRMIARSDFPYKRWSLLAAAYRLNIPVTVHVAIGTDIIHFHPSASGEAMGKASLDDFFLFASQVANLQGGGVFVNVGSAVVLPEVFLKAVSLVRNQGHRLDNFSAAVFDFIHHYRPAQNVVTRAVGEKARGFYFIGHHEIMIPLLAGALLG